MSTNGMTTSEMLEGSKLKVAKPAASPGGLGEAEIKELAKGMHAYLRDTFVPEFIEPLLKARERKLEARIRAIEERPLLEDCGTWNRSSTYYPGNVVTHDGSSWVARTSHAHGEPGKCDDWRLMVKRGRDGKDAPR
jgi:hypothetical protein